MSIFVIGHHANAVVVLEVDADRKLLGMRNAEQLKLAVFCYLSMAQAGEGNAIDFSIKSSGEKIGGMLILPLTAGERLVIFRYLAPEIISDSTGTL